jgi:hypothetical protein
MCSQNTTNNMSDSITVYYTTLCNIQLHVSALLEGHHQVVPWVIGLYNRSMGGRDLVLHRIL